MFHSKREQTPAADIVVNNCAYKSISTTRPAPPFVPTLIFFDSFQNDEPCLRTNHPPSRVLYQIFVKTKRFKILLNYIYILLLLFILSRDSVWGGYGKKYSLSTQRNAPNNKPNAPYNCEMYVRDFDFYFYLNAARKRKGHFSLNIIFSIFRANYYITRRRHRTRKRSNVRVCLNTCNVISTRRLMMSF